MKKLLLRMLSLCGFWSVAMIRVSASVEERIIYIQQDCGSEVMAFLGSMLSESWKNIVSVTAAFLCASAAIILAINHKKPGKQ